VADQRWTISTDQKDEVTGLLRRLPAILSGRLPDEHDIALGFRTRIGFALLSLIVPNFDRLGRGEPGDDGTRWPPLSREYLAYGRRFGPGERTALTKGAGLDPKKNKYAPGKTKAGEDKKGLLTKEQLKLWRTTYADRLAWYVRREPDSVAKAHAAAIAWIVVKKAGGKTKLEVFGGRKVQILVDTGYLRGSLLPGTIEERGPEAVYNPPAGKGASEQVFNVTNSYQVIVGTNVEYAKHHHEGKGNRHRPLWPESLPEEWWNQIIGIAISGLQEIKELYRYKR
jgi:hypothetical protein